MYLCSSAVLPHVYGLLNQFNIKMCNWHFIISNLFLVAISCHLVWAVTAIKAQRATSEAPSVVYCGTCQWDISAMYDDDNDDNKHYSPQVESRMYKVDYRKIQKKDL